MQLKLMHSTTHSLLLALTPQTVNATDKEKLLYGVEDIEYFIQDTWQVQCNGLQRLSTAFIDFYDRTCTRMQPTRSLSVALVLRLQCAVCAQSAYSTACTECVSKSICASWSTAVSCCCMCHPCAAEQPMQGPPHLVAHNEAVLNYMNKHLLNKVSNHATAYCSLVSVYDELVAVLAYMLDRSHQPYSDLYRFTVLYTSIVYFSVTCVYTHWWNFTSVVAAAIV
jgi:hypothetical protein